MGKACKRNRGVQITVVEHHLPGWSLELHPVVGRVGGFGVFFGDDRDTTAYNCTHH